MDDLNALRAAVATAVRGKDELVRRVAICLLAEGHLLIEDVPGVGKTTAARALAAAFDGRCTRIQFTPDLLPSDVTGVTVFDQESRTFTFHEGGIFANVVIADEINRASPKTQSALLEVMEERQVSVDGEPRLVPRPFVVVATQNPVEMDGTYPLPEAQLDRFLMCTQVGYPDRATEVEVVLGAQAEWTLASVPAVLTPERAAALIRSVRQVEVGTRIAEYAVDIVAATRRSPDVRLGASPRGGIALIRAAQAAAVIEGRGYVVPEDVKAIAVPVLAHRVFPTSAAELRGVTATAIVEAALAQAASPTSSGAR